MANRVYPLTLISHRKGYPLSEISQLRAAREAAGLTIEQVSKKTNIRMTVIEDLEKNSVEVCGGIAYARGHIRSIARVLKVDGDQLVAEIESAQKTESRRIIDRLYENNAADKPKTKRLINLGRVAVIAAIVVVIAFVVTFAIANIPSTNNKEVQTNQSQSTSTAVTDGVNLLFTGIDGKTWIGITNEAGEQIFNGQIKSGQSQSFSDKGSLKVIIGNAAAVKVSLNGTDLGVPGGYGEVVRFNYTSTGAIKE
jgi:cytoskeletal protein RodZ